MQGVTPDRHAYSTAATPRLTAAGFVQGAPRTYLHSLESCRADQDIITSSSAHRGLKTTRAACDGAPRASISDLSACVAESPALHTAILIVHNTPRTYLENHRLSRQPTATPRYGTQHEEVMGPHDLRARRLCDRPSCSSLRCQFMLPRAGSLLATSYELRPKVVSLSFDRDAT